MLKQRCVEKGQTSEFSMIVLIHYLKLDSFFRVANEDLWNQRMVFHGSKPPQELSLAILRGFV